MYCIQWITAESLNKNFFAAITEENLVRERRVEQVVSNHIEQWQQQGLEPDMAIEPGDKTDEPIRTRGWTYWHHLFMPRQLLGIAPYIKNSELAEGNRANVISILPDGIQRGSKLCRVDVFPGLGRLPKIVETFSNQALNTLYNFSVRSWFY